MWGASSSSIGGRFALRGGATAAPFHTASCHADPGPMAADVR
jgi:hypothetical protein